ncbi:MAG: MATE family efflux transporter [Spongiibacteraceae bacterium]|jgi:MATE family multidrug resistance protein|nr:MATE family efflux transporter [Spongiibacteraceae bacterium]
MSHLAPGYRRLLAMAGPIILANCAAPLLGLTDTAVIGHVGTAPELGAVALATLLFNLIYLSFGFFRMSTTAFVAQASGRDDRPEIALTVLRGIMAAVVTGAVLIAVQLPLIGIALELFGADVSVEARVRDYFLIRIWSAPATLTLYVLMGYLIGSAAGRALLFSQLLLNGLNIVLDVTLAGVLGWGITGLAWGTVAAEWLTVAGVGWYVLRQLDLGEPGPTPYISGRHALLTQLLDAGRLRQLFAVNGNILLRTLFLLASFAIFTDLGARFGATVLAGNHVLLQFISFSAFFLDGFAFTTESLTGRAFGARRYQQFVLVVRRTFVLAAATAALLAGLLWLAGPWIVAALTGLAEVQAAALHYLPFCALYVLLSFGAFQLDGIFLGTSQSVSLRNASFLATVIFIGLCWLWVPAYGNAGLWAAFTGFVVARALALSAYMPRLLRTLRDPG